MNQIGLFLCIYIRPLRAFGRVIDEGRLAFAVGVALLAMFAVQVPRHAEVEKLTAMALRYAKEHPAPLRTPPASAAAKTRAPEEVDEDSDGGPSGVPAPLAAMPISFAVDQFLGFSLFHYFPPLLSLAICFVPAALLILTLWDRMGRFSNVLFHNYLTLLLCALMAWAAAYLAMVNAAFLLAHRPGPLYVSLATWSAPV